MTDKEVNTICPSCKQPLVKNRGNQRFCSSACRARYWRVEKQYAKPLTELIMGHLAGLPETEQADRVATFEEAISEAFAEVRV